MQWMQQQLTTAVSGEFFVFQQDSAQAHRAHETVSFLACNFAKC